MNTFPQAPDNNIWIISNFFENSRRYSQVKVHYRWQIATGIHDTGGGKLPLLSTTPAANNGNNIRLLTHESELEGKNL